MLIIDSVPDLLRQHLHFSQFSQWSVSTLKLEKSSSVVFLHQAWDERGICEALYDLICMGLPASSVSLTPWEPVSKRNPGLFCLGNALASVLISTPIPFSFLHMGIFVLFFFPVWIHSNFFLLFIPNTFNAIRSTKHFWKNRVRDMKNHSSLVSTLSQCLTEKKLNTKMTPLELEKKKSKYQCWSRVGGRILTIMSKQSTLLHLYIMQMFEAYSQ